MCSVNCFPCWELNHFFVFQLTSSLKNWFDPLKKELVMVEPNPVRAWFLTWRHHRDHASIDGAFCKRKQARVSFSSTDDKLLNYFLLLLSPTSPVCKTTFSAHEEWSQMLLVLMKFNNGCLFFNLLCVHWVCHTEFASLTFSLCPALTIIASKSW